MRDPNQVFIFNDEELSLIKNTFAEDDALLYAVRKVLLQFPLTDGDRALIKSNITEPVWKVLKKRILPEISDEFPLTQLPSILTTLTEHLKVKDVAEMAPLFAAKALEIEYLAQQFDVLKNVDAALPQPINLELLSGIITASDEAQQPQADLQTYINLQAYLFLLGYIDPMLMFIKSIAGTKKETVEEAKKRMTRDSNK